MIQGGAKVPAYPMSNHARDGLLDGTFALNVRDITRAQFI